MGEICIEKRNNRGGNPGRRVLAMRRPGALFETSGIASSGSPSGLQEEVWVTKTFPYAKRGDR
jgi:hypothetical protein